ncbi:hypothetical protein CY34DRAFT_371672 [Suillus luteus UH-Slu-Lm8-n1]|uniref:Uncharacterized protein n=1 Tax=Suillus luteus UH-Slu-Lm8-n1 TaxID=930992 RepID=A0A0C9ZMB6_9AGAM|nr:hypothetical protein CY34DRAFT_371672 [Suillus luteus UH-Slu-Lm8-n1]
MEPLLSYLYTYLYRVTGASNKLCCVNGASSRCTPSVYRARGNSTSTNRSHYSAHPSCCTITLSYLVAQKADISDLKSSTERVFKSLPIAFPLAFTSPSKSTPGDAGNQPSVYYHLINL